MSSEIELARHFLAALAYRFQKALRGASEEFFDFEAGAEVRSPRDVLRHMNDLLDYAHGRMSEEKPEFAADGTSAERLIERFHERLEVLDEDFLGRRPAGELLRRLLQGPLADAMTHVGQLATLRRLAGEPVTGESFFEARITAENLSTYQAEPVRPFR